MISFRRCSAHHRTTLRPRELEPCALVDVFEISARRGFLKTCNVKSHVRGTLSTLEENIPSLMVDIFPSSAFASAAHRSWPPWRERYLIRTDLNAVSSTRTRKNGLKGVYEHRMKNPSDLCLEKYPCESSACMAYKLLPSW